MRNEKKKNSLTQTNYELNKDKSAGLQLPPVGFIPSARQGADTDPTGIRSTPKGLGVRSSRAPWVTDGS